MLKISLLLMGTIAAIVFFTQLSDIRRYLRIRAM